MKTKFLLLVCCLFLAKANVFATTWTINVGPNGSMTFDPSDLSVTLGDTLTWVWAGGTHTTTSTSVPSGAVAWDAPIDATDTSYSYVPAVVGSYAYQCTYHASMGMLGTFTVNACQPPVSTTIFGSTSICDGSPETLVVPQGPGYTFAWYRDGVAIPGANSNSYTVIDSVGVYAYNVVVSDNCGVDTTDTFTLIVNPVPIPEITDTVLSGTAVTFATNELFGATYLWDFGDGTTSVNSHPTHSFSMSGVTDTVTLTVTSMDSCVGTVQKVITTPLLGVNTLTAAGNIVIFPNPAKDEAVITYNMLVSKASLKLADVLGKVVYTTALTSQHGRISIPLNDLPAGLYLVEINAAGYKYVQKLEKQ